MTEETEWVDQESDVFIESIFITKHEMREIIDNFPTGCIYYPSSIWHGYPRYGHGSEKLKEMNISILHDFIAFLFEKHCDHIAESDAWLEFRAQELGLELIENNHPFFTKE